jgi:uncharacterized protein (TIGR02270 family)
LYSDDDGGDARPVLDTFVAEHADEASFLWLQRGSAVHAPNYGPTQFADLDERLEAHIDGLRVAGEAGWTLAEAALDNEGPEDFFPAAVLAIEATDDRLPAIIARAESTADVVPGVISALGWAPPKFLAGRVKSLLIASSPFQQMLGLSACDVHRKDPGVLLDRFLVSPDARVRSRAMRAAGELGRDDLMPELSHALMDDKHEVRYWASRSGVLLGDRGRMLDELTASALKPGGRQLPALQLTMQALKIEQCHDVMQQLAPVPDAVRMQIIGAGLVGSVHYVPWLLEQMSSALLARVAGEAFVNITGADFNLDQLEAMPPEGFEDGPTEDPADENVEVPEDVALPWPDVARVEAWWQKNASRFSLSTRYFLGAPVSTESCIGALKTGFQRQRIAASQYLCLINPGMPLFNTSAPARRQQALLATAT